MKAVKIILGVVAVVIILIAVAVTLFVSNLNGIVKEVIETAGSSSLQTAVKVNAVNIELTEGKGAISGLGIANPPGFSGNDLLTIGDVGLQLDINSLTGNVYVIKEVFFDGIALRGEQKNITDTNIQALIDNIKAVSSGGSSGSSQGQGGQDVRLMVEQLRVGDIQIALSSEQLGDRNITLPAYTQSNIGDKTTGLTPQQLSETIVTNLLTRVKRAVSNELETAAKDKLKEEAKGKLEEELKDKVDTEKLKSLFK